VICWTESMFSGSAPFVCHTNRPHEEFDNQGSFVPVTSREPGGRGFSVFPMTSRGRTVHTIRLC
jgi:hypothetical protein